MSDNVREQLSGKRQPLAEVIPTKLPISISLSMTPLCNLRCEYCEHSNDEIRNRHFSKRDAINMDVVHKLRDDLRDYPNAVKQILLCGLGEPLLHENIAEIVRTLKPVTGKVGIITNGTLLTRELACELLDSELDAFRVSLNGLTEEDYVKYTGRRINVDNIYDNLRYMKEESERRKAAGRKGCFIYVKILNYMVADDDSKTAFHERWGKVADVTCIENLGTSTAEVDFDKIADVEKEVSRVGGECITAKICPRPFYEAVIDEKGNVIQCCMADMGQRNPERIIGNIMDSNLADVWNNRRYVEFRQKLLGIQNMLKMCKECTWWQAMASREDLLDDKAEQLLHKYKMLNDGR